MASNISVGFMSGDFYSFLRKLIVKLSKMIVVTQKKIGDFNVQ